MFEGVCPDPGLLPPGGEHLDVSGGCSPPRLPDLCVLEVEGPPGGLARTLIGDLDELLVQGEVVPYRVLNTAIIINVHRREQSTEVIQLLLSRDVCTGGSYHISTQFTTLPLSHSSCYENRYIQINLPSHSQNSTLTFQPADLELDCLSEK